MSRFIQFTETPPGAVAVIVLSFAIFASAIAWPVTWYFSSVDRAAIAAGMTQRMSETGRCYWVKP
jgi:hypothetical protein